MNNNNILLDFGIPTCKTESVKDIVINVSARNDSFFNNFRISKEFSEKILDYYKQALEVPKYEKSNALSVLTNVIHIKKFEPVQLVEEDFWNADPYKNRSWQWGHHNWAGIWPLAQAAYIDNDKTSLEKLFERIEQWANIAMTEPTSQEMLWHDHSTALRLDKIVSLIALFANSISINQLKILKKLLICHAIILSHEDFYSKHTNHGYDQVLAMYQATHPSIIDGLEKLNRLAYRRLIDEIKFAFTEEGVHKENSPNYHRGMISNLIRGRKILNVLPCIDKGESLNFLDTILDKSLYFLACIAQPDSRIPIIGDSENSLLSKKLSQLSFYNNYKHYLFS
ncbi:MAG: heparinase II/III family protein, partial [Thermotogota bacterium]|nr:heparinase II/III family protein [Thermotogota bacterium]